MKTDLFYKIANNYEQLTANEQLIIDYIISFKTPNKLKIQDISDTLFLSSATIVRASKKLGYDSFSQLKFALIQNTKDSVLQKNTEKYNEIINRTQSDFDKTINMLSEKKIRAFANKIMKARRIFCIGSGSSISVASDFNRKLKLLNYWSNDYGELYSIKNATENSSRDDIIVIFSLSGNNDFINKYLFSAKSHGTKIISITGINANPVIELSNINLMVYETNVSRKHIRSRLMLNVVADIVTEYIINHTSNKK